MRSAFAGKQGGGGNYWERRVSYILRDKKQGGGEEFGSDFEAIHTVYYFRETLLEVIQNQEGKFTKLT